MKIPDLSEETYDDLEMTVTLDEETDAKRPLKEAMRKTGGKRIRDACMTFVQRLKGNISEGNEGKMVTTKAPPAARVNSQYVEGEASSSKTKSISFKYSFAPPPPVLYDSLLDEARMRGATASDCTISKEVGGQLSMFSGAVVGENLELKPYDGAAKTATIVWKWRFETWAAGHFSKVTITLEEKDGGTALSLEQSGVPEEECERTERGWKGMVFDRLKAMLGGSVMM